MKLDFKYGLCYYCSYIKYDTNADGYCNCKGSKYYKKRVIDDDCSGQKECKKFKKDRINNKTGSW